MKKETIREIAKDKGVKEINLFVEFFSLRFPNERKEITSYVSEWCDRFNMGQPERYMDITSLAIYKELKEVKKQ